MKKKNKNIKIFADIVNDVDIINMTIDYMKVHRLFVFLLYRLNILGFWQIVMLFSPMMRLAVTVRSLYYTKSQYDKMNIEESIFYDTMQDINIWINDYRDRTGKIGLEEFNWIRLHILMKIFKLGRLQYELTKYHFSKEYCDELKKGERCLNIHIPRGESLDIDKCKKSLCMANKFFSKYFQQYNTNYAVCSSWLLFSGNEKFMKEGSNILKFRGLFDIVEECECPFDAIRFTFWEQINNKKWISDRKKYGYYIDVKKFECITSLHSQMISYIKKGGVLGVAKGIICINKNS